MNSAMTQKVEDVFRDFKGRRAGVIRALTTESDDFYLQCDPGNKQALCLFGFPNETWGVNLPNDEVPPQIPEPVVGINFARVGIQEKDWLTFVALHSDSWLLSVAFCFAAKFGFDKFSRKHLFDKINQLPTVYDIVIGMINKRTKEKSSATNVSSHNSQSQSGSKSGALIPARYLKSARAEEEGSEEEEEDNPDEVCGKCNEYYSLGEFWICCDECDKWFHGKCVKVTEAEATNMKRYTCPSCSSSGKKSRAQTKK
uniref:PHD finger protein ALFIN-LIKE n=1 Tax=Kalanchoe fedtschenkoi TaxID=63787 RepID=A0A7N0V797_KALFE